nr:ABC transporter permease [Acidisoma sp. L85]
MLRVILKRLVLMPFLVLGIVTATFVLAQFTKGNPLVSIIGARGLENPDVVAAAKARWGLDRSVPERYVIYVANLAQGNLGTSFRTKQPVLTDLAQRLPATLELVICAMIVGAVSGILLGVISAQFRDTPADHTARFIALLGSCIPMFWLGLLVLFIFSVQTHLLPGPGRLDIRSDPPPTVTGFLLIDTLVAGEWSSFGRHRLLRCRGGTRAGLSGHYRRHHHRRSWLPDRQSADGHRLCRGRSAHAVGGLDVRHHDARRHRAARDLRTLREAAELAFRARHSRSSHCGHLHRDRHHDTALDAL